MSGYYPSSGIASNKDVSLEVIETVKRALLDFDPLDRDKKGLYDWQRTEMPNGFGRSDSTDYAELRSWLIRLGLLESKTVSPRREKQE
jgi:ABC-type phosphate/phosphonate transport system substrate-binding protein